MVKLNWYCTLGDNIGHAPTNRLRMEYIPVGNVAMLTVLGSFILIFVGAQFLCPDIIIRKKVKYLVTFLWWGGGSKWVLYSCIIL